MFATALFTWVVVPEHRIFNMKTMAHIRVTLRRKLRVAAGRGATCRPIQFSMLLGCLQAVAVMAPNMQWQIFFEKMHVSGVVKLPAFLADMQVCHL